MQSFRVATYNCDNATELCAETTKQIGETSPDLLVIGLQNCSDYKSVLKKISDQVMLSNPKTEYKLLRDEQAQGVAAILFAKKSI